MRALVFDSGPIISLALNGLLWILPELKKAYNGRFLIPPSVKQEIVDRPLRTRKFGFEARRVQHLLAHSVLEVIDDQNVPSRTNDLLSLANTCFEAHDTPLQILQNAEVAVLALAREIHADAVVIDERTTRMLIEAPEHLQTLLATRLHTPTILQSSTQERFVALLGPVSIIRSVELVTVAYDLGFLDKYLLSPSAGRTERRDLLESVLWALKLSGCAISENNIQQILKLEK